MRRDTDDAEPIFQDQRSIGVSLLIPLMLFFGNGLRADRSFVRFERDGSPMS